MQPAPQRDERPAEARPEARAGDPRIGDVGEDGLVAAVLSRYGRLPSGVLVGPGDDAAVLDIDAFGGGQLVLSTDTLVEGADFRHEWSRGHDVGVKVAAQNLADVAAMGARPIALLVSMAAPAHVPTRWAVEMSDGIAQECGRAGACVIGGDVSAASQIVLTATAVGLLDGTAVRRDGARVGDVVALAGSTGRSAAGLALLSAGFRRASTADSDLAALIEAHVAPRPGYAAGPAARAAGAHALIDTSDGLLRDAARVAAASGVVLDLFSQALAPSSELLRAAQACAGPPATGTAGSGPASAAQRALHWVLTGGEDHCLLATFADDQDLPEGYRIVGRVVGRPAASTTKAAGHDEVSVDGCPWEGPLGWQHFA